MINPLFVFLIIGGIASKIQVAHDVSFNAVVHQENVYAHSATLTFYGPGEFFWRTKAYSPHWTWFTRWSEVRYFWSTAD